MVTLLLGHWLADSYTCDGRCVWYPYSAVKSLGLGGTCGWVSEGAVVQLLGSV